MKGRGGITGMVKRVFQAVGLLFLVFAMIMGVRSGAFAASPGDIYTVAGGGIGDNGAATSASLNNPFGVAVDGDGNLYIADYYNHRIRKVTANTGIITTVAGNGTRSFTGDGGPATSATLYNPAGVAVDSAGNLYIADSWNHRIRKVAAGTGIITTVAGNGTAVYAGDGGLATSASLYYPSGVSLDVAGNLYVADQGNRCIRKVAAGTGIITTVAGNGTGGFTGDGGLATSASFNVPIKVDVDIDGNLYIADRDNNRIRKVAVGTGITTTIAGNGTGTFAGDGGLATSASLYNTNGVAIDNAGNLYIADKYNQRIRKVDAASGVISTVAGNGTAGDAGDGGPAVSASINFPIEVTVDSAGNLYITENFSHRIRKVAAGSGIITTVAGTGTRTFAGDGGAANSAGIFYPTGVTIDNSGNLYVADSFNHRIRKVAAGTDIITTVAGDGIETFGGDNGTATTASLDSPFGVTTDSIGNLYFADSLNNRIRKVANGSGIITTVAGDGTGSFAGDGGPATLASLNNPSAVSVDSFGNLFIADSNNNRVRMVEASSGIITTVAGDGSPAFAGDGSLALLASLNGPLGVTVDDSGNLYIADTNNHRIRKLEVGTGIITTVAGDGTVTFAGDGGLAVSASLKSPSGLAMDSSGNLYIADQEHHRIRKVTSDSGIITTVAGNGTSSFAGDGDAATSASLSFPNGMALDNAGNIYIADSNNIRIRKVIKPGATSAIISYSPSGPYKAGDLVSITATFNDLVADAPVPKIALAGANTLAATNMTKVDYTHYTYTHTVTEGTGVVSVSIPTGIDVNGIPISSTPSSGATFIVKTNQAITFSPAIATYGDAPLDLSSLAIGGGSGNPVTFTLVSGLGVLSGVNNVTLTINGAGNIVVRASQAGSIFYDAAADVQQTITVNKATATVTLGSLSQTYDGTAKSATATTSPSGKTVFFTYDGSATAPTNSGSYAVVGTIIDSNYTGSANGTLAVGVASQSITFGPLPDKTYGDSSFDLTATGGGSGNPVTFSSSNQAVATINGTTVTIIGAGSTTITASQAGSNNYASATAQQTLTVNKANQAITFGSAPSVVVNGIGTMNATGGASGNSITYSSQTTGICTVSGSIVTGVTAGSCTIVAEQAGNANYKAASQVTQTFSIGKGTPTITWNTPAAIDYGTLLSSAQLSAVAGAPGSFAYSPPVDTMLDAGAGQILSVTFTPDDAVNYSQSSASVTINVNKAAQSVNLPAFGSKAYGNADFGPGAAATSNLAISYASDNPSVATITPGGLVHIVGQGSAIITATQSGDGNYQPASAQQTLTVNKAALSVTADNKSRAYGAADPSFTASYSGFVNGEDSSVIIGVPTFTTTATAVSPEGSYLIIPNLSSLSAANYIFVAANGTLAVGLASQTIIFNALPSKIFGDSNFDITASGGLSGNPVTFTSSDTSVATISGSTVTIKGAGSTTIVANQAGIAGEYASATAQQILTVNKALITVTADNKQRLYNTPNATFTVTYSGFVGSDDSSAISGAPTFTTTATQASPVGSYTIIPVIDSLTASNYTFNAVNGTLAVDVASQTIIFDPLAGKTYGDAAFDLSAIGGASGNTVTFSSSNPAVATVSGTTVTVTGAGTTTITVTQTGNSNYASAITQQTLTVNKAVLTVTPVDAGRTYNTANPTFIVGYSGFVNHETAADLNGAPVISTTADVSSPVGSYPIVAAAGNLFSNNYSFSYGTGTLTIGKATADITLGSLSATYDGTPKAVTATSTPTGLAVVLTYNTSTTVPTAAGSYNVVATVNDANYIGTANASLVIAYSSTPPTLNLSTLADGSITNNATLNISGKATSPNGIKSVTVNGTAVTLDADGGFSKALTLQLGNNTIITVVTDNADLTTTDTRGVTLDTTAPAITITSPADNSSLAASSVVISGTVDKTATIQATVNGGTAQSAAMNGNSFSVTLNLAPGSNTIAVSALDLAGNSATVKRTVVSDTTKPTLAIIDPAQDITTTQASLTISGTVSDAVTTASITITCDGQSYTPQVESGVFQQLLSFASQKQYAITVTATDQAGNSVTTQRNVIYALPLLPSGDISGDGNVDISDALLALQMAVGIVSPTQIQLAAGDVAPLAAGKPAPDGAIEITDAMLILEKAIGLLTWQ